MSKETVKVFLTERLINGEAYAEQVCARSFAEAEAICALSGAKLLGEMCEEHCAECGTLIQDGSSSPEEWPEEIQD